MTTYIEYISFLIGPSLLIAIIVLCIQGLRQKESIVQRNREIMKNQPDEPYKPGLYPIEEILKGLTVGDDDPLYYLGGWFQSLGYHERHGITLERYVQMVENGTWQDLARA